MTRSHITRRFVVAGVIIRCSTCGDFALLGGDAESDAAWFEGRHPDGDHQPPSLMSAKGKR